MACPIPQGVTQIDATGKATLPGLIDLHGHFFAGKAQDTQQSVPAMIWDQ